jgi:hypothetical protein
VFFESAQLTERARLAHFETAKKCKRAQIECKKSDAGAMNRAERSAGGCDLERLGPNSAHYMK